MPDFLITSPEGKQYQITGPEGATHEQALAILQQQLGGGGYDPKDAENYAKNFREFGTTDQLAHSATMGLTRPLHAGFVAVDRGARNLLAGQPKLSDLVNDKRPETMAEAFSRGQREYDAARTKYSGEHPILSPIASVLGGAASFGPSAAAGAGGVLPAMWQGAKGGGLYGGVSGAAESSGDLGDRAVAGVKGAAIGAGIGAAIPPVLEGGRLAISPLTSQIQARMNPAAYAEKQFGRMVTESGLQPQQIGAELTQAAQEGQPVFSMADALGNAGQRGLSTVARSPGPGRTDAVNFLESRQADQGRRMANTLAEGFNASETALATGTRLEAARTAAADVNYGAARQSANPVDVTPAIKLADAYLRPGATKVLSPGTNIAKNSVESAVERAKSYLTDGRSQLSKFDDVLQAKIEIDNMIETATKSQQRILVPISKTLDNQLAAVSKPYAHARDTFAAQSKGIEAIDLGRNASQRGRYEDTIPQFNALPPQAKQPFRVGYIDPEIAKVQGAAYGVNKARPYTSDAFIAESNAMAPRAPEMQRRIARENTMFQTRNTALGGSKTFDNLADDVAMGLSPEVIAKALSGGVKGIVKQGYSAAANLLTGNTAAVRQHVGQLLRMNGMNATPAEINAILQRANQINTQSRLGTNALQRGISGGSLGLLDNIQRP